MPTSSFSLRLPSGFSQITSAAENMNSSSAWPTSPYLRLITATETQVSVTCQGAMGEGHGSTAVARSSHMMAKRKGKVTAVNSAGFASRYRGTPYVSTTAWNTPVNLLVRKCVGSVGHCPPTGCT